MSNDAVSYGNEPILHPIVSNRNTNILRAGSKKLQDVEGEAEHAPERPFAYQFLHPPCQLNKPLPQELGKNKPLQSWGWPPSQTSGIGGVSGGG